jgi:phosphoserine phosphatase
MNLYDFDGTIYRGDSTADFFLFCLKAHPKILLSLPKASICFLMYKLKRVTKTRFKEVFYEFVRLIPNIDDAVYMFWKTHKKNLKSWYLKQKQPTDIIISASPEFLLTPICRELGVKLIASRVDKQSGKTIGENCWGDEKVRRLFEVVPDAEINNFYSDAISDQPLATLAQKSYLVKDDMLKDWP